MNIFGLGRHYRTAKRLKQIVNVFLRHGFGNLIDQIHLGRYIPFFKRFRTQTEWPSLLKGPYAPQRLRKAFAELGPSFVKFAQIISTRQDLVPSRYADEFKKLQDNVPPFSSSEARTIIEQSLKAPFDEVFSEFSCDPIAAASIAQVHTATLMDGTEVVVKVQRPGIREQLEADIEILFNVARLIESNIPESKYFNPVGIVFEFQRTVMKELNFVEEGRNCARFKKNFTDFKGIYIPTIYPQYISEKVLVMERISGVRIDNLEGIRIMGHDTRHIAKVGVDAYFKMILKDGFFHADPHPGNMIVMESGDIGFMDFGMAGWVNDDLRLILTNIFLAFINRDFDRLVDQHIEMGFIPADIDLTSYRRDFKADLAEFMEPLHGMKLSEINFAEYLNTTIKIIVKHKMKIPSDLLLINKVTIMLQDMGKNLDPDFDFVSASTPYVVELARNKYDPSRVFDRASKGFTEFVDFVDNFPKQSKRLMSRMLNNDITIKINHVGLDHLIKDMDRSSNRIAFAMVLSSILLSSAIMHAGDVGPKFYGMSVLGFMVFGLAAFLGIGLIISIFRSGRL